MENKNSLSLTNRVEQIYSEAILSKLTDISNQLNITNQLLERLICATKGEKE